MSGAFGGEGAPGYFYIITEDGRRHSLGWAQVALMLREAGHDVMVQPGFQFATPPAPAEEEETDPHLYRCHSCSDIYAKAFEAVDCCGTGAIVVQDGEPAPAGEPSSEWRCDVCGLPRLTNSALVWERTCPGHTSAPQDATGDATTEEG